MRCITAAQRAVPLSEYPAQRIALIKPSALGDIVHSLPVLTALRRRYPEAHITWVVGRAYQSLLAGHPDLDAVLPFERLKVHTGPVRAVFSFWKLLHGLRTGQFDLVIDLQGLLRSGLISLATGAPRRVGLATSREGSARCYTDLIPVPGGDRRRSSFLHAVDRYRLVTQALGGRAGPAEFRLPPFPEAAVWADAMLRECPRPWLVLGLGARWRTKRWPAEHFASLARRAQQRWGGTIVFVGSRDDAAAARQVAETLPGPWRDLTGATTLPQLTALLRRADVMLANDTGPLHLAAALGRPVVAPYTCTRPELHGPFAARGGAVATQVWCAGSYRKRCRRLDCMTELTPERVWPVLEEVMQQWQKPSRTA
jgi:lipopolysaccharide heptosyltransferase I